MDEKDLLGRRRDRAIATILSYKERECDHFLDEKTSKLLRQVILDQINDVCDLAFDVISSLEKEPTIVLNDNFLDALEEFYS